MTASALPIVIQYVLCAEGVLSQQKPSCVAEFEGCRQPAGRRMAIVAAIAAVNMVGVLAGRRHSVMA